MTISYTIKGNNIADGQDRESWATWVSQFAADLSDVKQVDVLSDGRVQLIVYKEDENGFRFVEPGSEEAVVFPPRIVEFVGPLPPHNNSVSADDG